MKKIIVSLIVLLTSMAMQAEDLTGLKIYVNPGHGGYDSDDRSIWTIPVPELWTNPDGYWESKSNLVKGLALRDLLEEAGATVIMSRTQNRTQDDRNLSEIAAEANANHVDHFLSIHSNALTGSGTTNYLLLLFHGYDNAPTVAESLPMVQNSGPIQFDNPLTVWSSSAINLRGDFTFYGNTSGLGVLRPLTVPGFLSEGSFHDYPPETHRLCNNDYCKLEALRFFKHFHTYFKRDMPVNGTIAGWVKSENELVTVLKKPQFLYRTFSDDQWLPLNGATVELLDASGATVLETYTTDDWYNGIFAFYDIAPGNYKIRASIDGYEENTVDVTLAASGIAYAKVRLNNPDVVTIDPDLEIDFPDPNEGMTAPANYSFKAINSPVDPDWLSGNNIKRVLYRNEKLYVLTTDSKILVVNAKTETLIKELNVTDAANLSDIAFTADNYLLACNKTTVPFESADQATWFKVYTWEDENAAPKLFFQSNKAGNFNDGVIGETFAVSGPLRKCKIYAPATSITPSHWRVVGFQYEENTPVVSLFMDADAPYSFPYADVGEHPIFTITPNGNGDRLYIDSEKLPPAEYKFDWTKADRTPLEKIAEFAEVSDYTLPDIARGGNYFRNAGHNYLAMPVCEADGADVGVVLFDVTNGLDKAKKVSEKYPEDGLGETPASYMVAAGVVSGQKTELLVLAKNQGMARYKTSVPVANIYASELSYLGDGTFRFTLNENADEVILCLYDEDGAKVEEINAGDLNKGIHTLSDVFAANLRTGKWSWDVTAKAEAVTEPARLTSGREPQLVFYSPRGVSVDNSFDSPFFGRIYVAESLKGKSTEQPFPIDDTRSTSDGVYILNAVREDITGQGATPYAGGQLWEYGATPGASADGSPMRLTVAPDGKVYINDLSKPHSGIYIMDPANPSANFTPLFTGTRDNNTGLVSYDGTPMHGPISHCYVEGLGEDTKLYTFDDEYASNGKKGNLLRYDIGTTVPCTTPPEVIWENNGSFYVNTGLGTTISGTLCSIAPDGRGGWWISNSNNAVGNLAGANETASQPALIHINAEGTADFNSYNDIPAANRIGINYRGGMAVNYTGDKLAIGAPSAIIKVFTITYEADNKPSLTLAHNISATFGGSTGSNNDGMAFDRAGNFYAVSTACERLGMWTLPKADNSFTTPGASFDNDPTRVILPNAATGLEVYPNPVVSDLTIAGKGMLINEYTLYDLNGRSIRAGKVNAAQITLPVTGLSAGVYVLQVRTTEGVVVKRIVKR